MTSGFDRLRNLVAPAQEPMRLTPNPAFVDYLKIHKVLVGPSTALELISTAESLDKDDFPHYLVAAGSAYCEAALALDGEPTVSRMELLDRAESSWSRALELQLSHLEISPYSIDAADPFRSALDIARLPLIRGIVAGDVTQHTRDEVRAETLAIAAANNVRGRLAYDAAEKEIASSHIGFGHEANFVIAADSLDTPSLIAVSSFARSDTGHFYPNQTHDLMFIQQKWGNILDILPVEVKAKTGKNARNRYCALLIRGKVHLTYNVGFHEPENMRRAFANLYEDNPSKTDVRITREIRKNLLQMVHLYKSGDVLGQVATMRSLLRFRDPTRLHEHHPEIAPSQVLRQ